MLKCHVLTTRLPLTVLIGFLLDTDQYEYGCLDITRTGVLGVFYAGGTARLGKIGSLGSLVVVFYAGGTARLGKVGGSQVLPGLPPSVLWESWELSPDDELWANRRRQHHPAAIRKGARGHQQRP